MIVERVSASSENKFSVVARRTNVTGLGPGEK
jgi:hypothetical protein